MLKAKTRFTESVLLKHQARRKQNFEIKVQILLVSTNPKNTWIINNDEKLEKLYDIEP